MIRLDMRILTLNQCVSRLTIKGPILQYSVEFTFTLVANVTLQPEMKPHFCITKQLC